MIMGYKQMCERFLTLPMIAVSGPMTRWGLWGLYTSFAGYSPLYHLVSFSDYKKEEAEAGLFYGESDEFQSPYIEEEESPKRSQSGV